MKRNRTRRRWLFVGITSLLAVLLVLKLFVADLYTIPQNGMYPTLPQGSRFLALKRPFHDASEVRRGDIIVFVRTVGGSPYTFVWRVVGLPADRVEVTPGDVTINGQPLAHQELRKDGSMTVYRETNGAAVYEVAYRNALAQTMTPPTVLTIPPGEFFVLGDNRDDARDSRVDGTVPFASIIARKLR